MHIVKIEPVPEHFSITWMLGSFCNYDCMYCATEWHDTVSRPHTLEMLQKTWEDIYQKSQTLGLPYKISFTGGEVTANRPFLPFVKWLRQNFGSAIDMILITTNGSASLRYYLQLAQVVEAISFSTHSEFMDEATFFHKVREINKVMIRPKKSVHVNIMDEPWNRSRIPEYVAFCQRHNISHSVNSIDMSLRTRDDHAPLPEKTLERLD